MHRAVITIPEFPNINQRLRKRPVRHRAGFPARLGARRRAPAASAGSGRPLERSRAAARRVRRAGSGDAFGAPRTDGHASRRPSGWRRRAPGRGPRRRGGDTTPGRSIHENFRTGALGSDGRAARMRRRSNVRTGPPMIRLPAGVLAPRPSWKFRAGSSRTSGNRRRAVSILPPRLPNFVSTLGYPGRVAWLGFRDECSRVRAATRIPPGASSVRSVR